MPTSRHLLRLADNYWLTAHDQRGRGCVSQHAIGLGLAGCLLGELVISQKIIFTTRGTVKIINPSPPPDRVGATLLGLIKDEVTEPNGVVQIRDWLNYLSGVGYPWVAQRLLENRVVEEVQVRQGLRKVNQFHVLDVNNLMEPAVHVSSRLRGRTPLEVYDVAFARFVYITNLASRFDPDLDEASWSYLRSLQDVLGFPPSLQFVLAETESMYGAAVLAHRI
jgi:hypothetical protein